MCRRAFTLLEVMVVVTLMGLLAGAVAWSLAQDAQRTSRQSIAGQISHADRMARLTAKRLGKTTQLRFDIDQQYVRRVVIAETGHEEILHTLRLPNGCRIDQVLLDGVSERSEEVRAADASPDSGIASIGYSSGGRSKSYAVHLRFEGGRTSSDSDGEFASGSGWLVFSGLTGQVTFLHDEDKINNLFAMLATGGPDAH